MADLPVDIYVDKIRIGGTYLSGGQLGERVSRASTSTAPMLSPRDCHHDAVAEGFAYVEWHDHHWPVRVCTDCRSILNGRSPYVAVSRRSLLDMATEQDLLGDVIRAKWAKQWPKHGRPRAKRPPQVEWPDALEKAA